MRLTPVRFDQHPVHFLELDDLPPESFDDFIDRHLLLLRYAYTVAEGAANPVIALSDNRVERIYTPDDFNPEGGPETNEQFIKRAKKSMDGINIERLFFHALTPMLVTNKGVQTLQESMLWYAKEASTGAERVGVMAQNDNEGHHRVLEAPGAESANLKGWIAEALADIL